MDAANDPNATTDVEDFHDHADSFTLQFSGWILGVGAIGAILIALVSLVFLPTTSIGSGRIDSPHESATREQRLAIELAQLDAEGNVRDIGLRIALGFGAVSAALVGYGRLQLSQAEHRHAERVDRQQHERAERGQNNERWTAAVAQLGSERIEIRLGGIFALEQFYRDAPDERARTLEVIAAFVRSNLPPRRAIPDVPEHLRPAPLPADIQAGLTVLGGLATFGQTSSKIDLTLIDLSVQGRYQARLGGADLSGAVLSAVDFGDAEMIATRLAGATMVGAKFTNAFVPHADFTDALLTNADLRHALELPDTYGLHTVDLTRTLLPDDFWYDDRPPPASRSAQ